MRIIKRNSEVAPYSYDQLEIRQKEALRGYAAKMKYLFGRSTSSGYTDAMPKPEIISGESEACAQALDISLGGLIGILSDLTATCVAGPERAGLAVAYAPEFLLDQVRLTGARLALARVGETIAGFALYHVDDRFFPAPVEKAAKFFGSLGRMAYGHLVAVKPEFRGSEFKLYDLIAAAARADARKTTSLVIGLVRAGNEHAREAHLRRGWIPTGVQQIVTVKEKTFEFEYLVMRSGTDAAEESLIREFRLCAERQGAPLSIR